MNSKKMGMFAVAALTVLATQANANDTKAKDNQKAAAEKVGCWNGCGGKPGNEKGSCKGKVEYKDKTTKDACVAHGGEWHEKKAK